MAKSSKRLLIIFMLVIFTLGFESGGFQLALLNIGRDFNLDESKLGLIVSLQYFAIILFPLWFGRYSDKIGKKITLMIFAGLFALGCFITMIPLAIVFAVGIFVLGAGYSMCESTVSALIGDVYPDKVERYQNITQACFSLGAMISPLINNVLINNWGINWRIIFLTCAALFLLVILLTARSNVPRKKSEVQEKSASYKILLRPTFIFLFIAIVMCVSLENGFSYFMGMLFENLFLTPHFTPYALSLFWMGNILSRLITAVFYKAVQRISLIAFAGIAVVAFLLIGGTAQTALVCFFLLGFFLGPIWPVIMSYATGEFPENTGMVCGVIMAGCGIGGAFSPIMMGFTTQYVGISVSFVILGILAALGALSLVLYFIIKQKNKNIRV